MAAINRVPARSSSTKSILNICAGILLLLLISAPSYSALPGTSMHNGDILVAGDSLNVGRDCKLIMQKTDCNLVLYVSQLSIWYSGTAGKGDHQCQLQLTNNGQLVITSGAGKTVWTSSNQPEDSQYTLGFDGNCNIAVRNLQNGHMVWSSCPTAPITPCTH